MVVNRLNVAQLYELSINFMSDNIVRAMKELPKYSEKAKMLFDYIKDINETQYNQLKSYYNALDKADKLAFIDTTMKDGIYIHQPPFWNNLTLDDLAELYEKYDWIKPYECTVDGKKILKPLIIADHYFLKLKHEPQSLGVATM